VSDYAKINTYKYLKRVKQFITWNTSIKTR